MNSRNLLGPQGEDFAVNWIKTNNITVLHRNWTCMAGEIDIIGNDHEALIFFEVKARQSLAMGHPLESVTLKKQRQIIRASKLYLQQFPPKNLAPRYDVISILWLGKEPEVEWIPGAFGENSC